MSYKFPSLTPPRQRQHHPLPAVQTYYPLSLADAPQPPPSPSTALALPANGFDLRTLLLLFVAAGVGMWLYKRFFSTKKKMASNERMFFTTAGPLRGLDRIGKRLKQHADLLKRDGYDGIASDLREASDLIESFTGKTREQTLEG